MPHMDRYLREFFVIEFIRYALIIIGMVFFNRNTLAIMYI